MFGCNGMEVCFYQAQWFSLPLLLFVALKRRLRINVSLQKGFYSQSLLSVEAPLGPYAPQALKGPDELMSTILHELQPRNVMLQWWRVSYVMLVWKVSYDVKRENADGGQKC